jgi:thiamine-monophosphate kinase
MKISDIGEIALIRRLTKGLWLDRSVIKGAGDDTAVMEWTAKKYLLFTCDMLVEGVHFDRKRATPFRVGWKALGRNLSDIAAMGGLARYAVVSIALPGGLDARYADGIYRGMKELARRYRVSIVGGDVSKSDKIAIDVALIGEVEKANLVTRAGARRGDVILVTGSVGGSAGGRHLDFTPRIREARAIVTRFKVNSMIDVSDGLLLDLWRILEASRKGARIYQNMIPLSKGAGRFDQSVREGEDFELLFTMGAAEARRFFRAYLAKMETPVTLIGEVMERRYGYRLVRPDGAVERIAAGPAAKGYLHF